MLLCPQTLTFNFSDSSASVKLWNNFANSFLEHIEGIAGQPMSVMISSCKVIFHQGTYGCKIQYKLILFGERKFFTKAYPF